MPETSQLSVPASTATSTSGSAKRRSIRFPRFPNPSEVVVGSSDTGNVLGDKDSEMDVVQANSSPPPGEGWKHPAELQYIRRADWSQDLMITYLCQKAFTVPPRQLNTTLSYTEITRSFSGEKIHVPRGYRIPLMFVAKFQWDSLQLVLNSTSEWEEYKFDIIHLSRLCTHFFKQAKSAASENKLTKSWRSPMFDRALIRFYRKWMVSREWSVKKFWEEFEEDEYKLDVLKFDWSRWVLRGHKGFVLTKEEVQNGITADQYTDGLKRRPDGTWIWGGDDSGTKATSLDALTCLASQDAVESITDATPSHDSLEMKQELLQLDKDDVGLNMYGKRRRGDDGDSPRKFSARLSKKSRAEPEPKMSARRKAASPLFKSASSVSSGDERPETKGNQHAEDITISKYAALQSFISTNKPSFKITPLSLSHKRKVALRKKPGKSTSSTTTTIATVSTDVPSDHSLNLLPIPTLTDHPARIMEPFPRASTQPEDVGGTVLTVSTDENRDGGICFQSPLSSDARVLNPILKSIPNPWPTRPLHIAASARSEAGSSSLAPGNSDVSNNGQESNPRSRMTPIDPLMQIDSADPETMPNGEVPDPATNDPIIDAPQFGILPSSDQLSSSITTLPVSPSSSLPEANPSISGSTTSIITPTPILSSTSNVPEVAHTSVLSPSPPQDLAVTSDDSSGPLDSDLGDANRASNTAFLPELKVKIIQTILDTVQKMTAARQIREPQTITVSRPIDAGEEEGNNMVEDAIVIPLSPVLCQNEELEYPGNVTSGAGEVETIVVGTQSVVEKVDTEENGIGSEVTNGEDPSTTVLADTGSVKDAVEGEKDAEGKDMVDEPEVMGTMDDLNGTDVRMETFAVETQPLQSGQETTTVGNMDEADVVLEKGGVEVHTETCQATPMNDTDAVGIALEVGAVEGQSLVSQSFTGTPTAPITDSKAAYHSVSSHGELEGGDVREVETTHVGNSEDKMIVDEEIVQPIQITPPLPTDESSLTNTHYAVRMKSLHSIQLLQGLTHFLRMPAQDGQLEVPRMREDNSASLKSQGMHPVIGQAHYPPSAGLRLTTEEALSVDQRLDVLSHVSVTLAKNLYPYRGKELETKIDILDKSLQQQFETIQKLDGRSCGEMNEPFRGLGAHPDTAFDTSTGLTSTETLSQGVQTSLPSHVNRQFESVEVQTEAEFEVPAPQQPLSADATMVDLAIHTPPFLEPPSTSAAKAECQPEDNRSVAKTVMSIMRNMADLLECTTQGGSVKSFKGKEKEVTDVDMMPSYLDSPAFTTILEEFKSMKEEMRRSQHRSQSEVESIRLSHFMEVEALKAEIRTIESKGKQKLEEVTRQYSQQIGELKSTIRLKEESERARDREKESGSEKLPSLELLEIRRRVASLEARSRSDSSSVDMLRSGSRASMTNGHFQEPVISRHPPPHLPTDFEEQSYTTTFRGPGQFMREGSMSKPGTPALSDRNLFSNRHPDVMDLDENMPLPAKSQRKMHMMNFLRPPVG